MEYKIFATLGIITIISGILLTIMGSYIPGIGGTIVGIWLATDNINKIRAK
jgi:hypothetical protein